jgi:hypothetical protein
MTFNDFLYKAGLLKYLTLRVVMFAILVYVFAHEVSATEVTITTYGTDVVFNGETLRGNDNGSPVTYTVLDTKHVKKVFKYGFGDNVTTNTGDEDIVYAGTNPWEVFTVETIPGGDIQYVVKFTDGPIVVFFGFDEHNRPIASAMNMPPWGSDYYLTAEKLYKASLHDT